MAIKRFALAALASVLQFSTGVFVRAAPSSNVTHCVSDLDFSINSLEQTPCLVAAYLFAECTDNGAFTVNSVSTYYLPPSNTNIGLTKCSCSSVAYTTIAACSACQNITWGQWTSWTQNCGSDLITVGSWPLNSLPVGTSVPHWAYQDPTTYPNGTFNVASARSLGDNPESSAVSASQTSTGSSGSSSSSSASPSSTRGSGSGGGGSSHTGAIGGGVVGGILGLAILGAILAFILIRHKRSQSNAAPSGMTGHDQHDYGQGPMMGYADGPTPQKSAFPTSYDSPGGAPTGINYGNGYESTLSSGNPQTFYNPNDPNTFPASPSIFSSQQGTASHPTGVTGTSPNPYTNHRQSAMNGQGQGVGYSGMPEV